MGDICTHFNFDPDGQFQKSDSIFHTQVKLLRYVSEVLDSFLKRFFGFLEPKNITNKTVLIGDRKKSWESLKRHKNISKKKRDSY